MPIGWNGIRRRRPKEWAYLLGCGSWRGGLFGGQERRGNCERRKVEAKPVKADKPPESWSWPPPGAVVVDGAKLAECRREIAQARELLQAIAERFE